MLEVTFFIPAIRDATPGSSPALSELNAVLGVAPHLLLFPVVAALPTGRLLSLVDIHVMAYLSGAAGHWGCDC